LDFHGAGIAPDLEAEAADAALRPAGSGSKNKWDPLIAIEETGGDQLVADALDSSRRQSPFS
jgi:hypothetical protein